MKNKFKVWTTRAVAIVVLFAVVFSMSGKTQSAFAAATTNYTIKVNLGTNCTTIYDKSGKAIKAMICSPSNDTPTGTFYVPVKYRWHEMIGNCYAQYCTRITTGILFHSIWYYKNGDKSSMSVAAYNKMGQKDSHGCVRLLCKDAKWIYDHCAVGTKIVIFKGTSKDDPLGRPSFTPIGTGAFTSWDPTDPDPANPYKNSKPTITAKSLTIEYGSKVNKKDLVTIKDSLGNDAKQTGVKVKVKGNINTKKLGSYKLKYKATDALGHKASKTITFKVVDTKKPIIKGAKSKKNVAMGSTLNVKKGVSARAVSGKKLTSRIKISAKYKNKKVKVKKNRVTFENKGTYKITYSVKGANGKTAKKTVKYKVKDHRVKFALSSKSVTLSVGDHFDPYAYIDYVKTYKGKTINKNKNVKYKGSVDTSTPGTYTVVYTAQSGDKKYTQRQRTLRVKVKEKDTVDIVENESGEDESENTTAPENESSTEDGDAGGTLESGDAESVTEEATSEDL